eukprot:4247245-Amphidinium_carterae.2
MARHSSASPRPISTICLLSFPVCSCIQISVFVKDSIEASVLGEPILDTAVGVLLTAILMRRCKAS